MQIISPCLHMAELITVRSFLALTLTLRFSKPTFDKDSLPFGRSYGIYFRHVRSI
jgi:hypothetical protein